MIKVNLIVCLYYYTEIPVTTQINFPYTNTFDRFEHYFIRTSNVFSFCKFLEYNSKGVLEEKMNVLYPTDDFF